MPDRPTAVVQRLIDHREYYWLTQPRVTISRRDGAEFEARLVQAGQSHDHVGTFSASERDFGPYVCMEDVVPAGKPSDGERRFVTCSGGYVAYRSAGFHNRGPADLVDTYNERYLVTTMEIDVEADHD